MVKVKSAILSGKKDLNLLVHGQGVFIFNSNLACSFSILNFEKNGLIVFFNEGCVQVSTTDNKYIYVDNSNNKGIINTKGAYYWFSLDSQNQILMAGIGEARIDNIIYRYEFIFKTDEERKTNKLFLENLISIKADDFIHPIRLLRDPISTTLPLKVARIDDLTMNDIASQRYMPLENLSLVSQKLYNSIGGKKFILDDMDFPNFSRAIEYSIATEGCWCNTKLKEKASDFNPNKPNILETYLRITMGKNNGESPGQMLVMEIWPKGGHFSPIHSHANCEAIIRVLHGSINVSLFPYLSGDKVEPFLNANFNKDDVTWISPTLNQVHQLKNISETTSCITIQCYSYDLEDVTHYDYFDYIGENGETLQFDPVSDMDFVLFKQKMKEEWINRPRNCLMKCFGLLFQK
jgi:hypothetical protein